MSTSLRTFDVELQSDADHARISLEATSAEAVLAAAKTIAESGRDLPFQPYETGTHAINSIIIIDHDGTELARWCSDELILRRCAPDLLHTLQRAMIALNAAPRFKVRDLACDSYAIAAECGHAIADATGRN